MAYLGIDIGGTKTLIAVVENGRIVQSSTLKTERFDESLAGILAAGHTLNHSTGLTISAVGIGCPGPLDDTNGVVLNDDTLIDWHGKQLVSPFRESFKVPVSLINDAAAALLGEVSSGSLKPFTEQPVAMLTFGTGVGGAAWNGTSVARGAYGEHPEIGHIVVDPSGPPCYCGYRGCLESIASGTALNAAARAAGYGTFDSLASSNPKHEIVENARRAVTAGLWTLAHAFRPAAVALGGGMIEHYSALLIDPNALRGETLLLKPMVVVPAALGNQAGAIGAAFLASRISQ